MSWFALESIERETGVVHALFEEIVTADELARYTHEVFNTELHTFLDNLEILHKKVLNGSENPILSENDIRLILQHLKVLLHIYRGDRRKKKLDGKDLPTLFHLLQATNIYIGIYLSTCRAGDAVITDQAVLERIGVTSERASRLELIASRGSYALQGMEVFQRRFEKNACKAILGTLFHDFSEDHKGLSSLKDQLQSENVFLNESLSEVVWSSKTNTFMEDKKNSRAWDELFQTLKVVNENDHYTKISSAMFPTIARFLKNLQEYGALLSGDSLGEQDFKTFFHLCNPGAVPDLEREFYVFLNNLFVELSQLHQYILHVKLGHSHPDFSAIDAQQIIAYDDALTFRRSNNAPIFHYQVLHNKMRDLVEAAGAKMGDNISNILDIGSNQKLNPETIVANSDERTYAGGVLFCYKQAIYTWLRENPSKPFPYILDLYKEQREPPYDGDEYGAFPSFWGMDRESIEKILKYEKYLETFFYVGYGRVDIILPEMLQHIGVDIHEDHILLLNIKIVQLLRKNNQHYFAEERTLREKQKYIDRFPECDIGLHDDEEAFKKRFVSEAVVKAEKFLSTSADDVEQQQNEGENDTHQDFFAHETILDIFSTKHLTQEHINRLIVGYLSGYKTNHSNELYVFKGTTARLDITPLGLKLLSQLVTKSLNKYKYVLYRSGYITNSLKDKLKKFYKRSDDPRDEYIEFSSANEVTEFFKIPTNQNIPGGVRKFVCELLKISYVKGVLENHEDIETEDREFYQEVVSKFLSYYEAVTESDADTITKIQKDIQTKIVSGSITSEDYTSFYDFLATVRFQLSSQGREHLKKKLQNDGAKGFERTNEKSFFASFRKKQSQSQEAKLGGNPSYSSVDAFRDKYGIKCYVHDKTAAVYQLQEIFYLLFEGDEKDAYIENKNLLESGSFEYYYNGDIGNSFATAVSESLQNHQSRPPKSDEAFQNAKVVGRRRGAPVRKFTDKVEIEVVLQDNLNEHLESHRGFYEAKKIIEEYLRYGHYASETYIKHVIKMKMKEYQQDMLIMGDRMAPKAVDFRFERMLADEKFLMKLYVDDRAKPYYITRDRWLALSFWGLLPFQEKVSFEFLENGEVVRTPGTRCKDIQSKVKELIRVLKETDYEYDFHKSRHAGQASALLGVLQEKDHRNDVYDLQNDGMFRYLLRDLIEMRKVA